MMQRHRNETHALGLSLSLYSGLVWLNISKFKLDNHNHTHTYTNARIAHTKSTNRQTQNVPWEIVADDALTLHFLTSVSSPSMLSHSTYFTVPFRILDNLRTRVNLSIWQCRCSNQPTQFECEFTMNLYAHFLSEFVFFLLLRNTFNCSSLNIRRIIYHVGCVVCVCRFFIVIVIVIVCHWGRLLALKLSIWMLCIIGHISFLSHRLYYHSKYWRCWDSCYSVSNPLPSWFWAFIYSTIRIRFVSLLFATTKKNGENWAASWNTY